MISFNRFLFFAKVQKIQVVGVVKGIFANPTHFFLRVKYNIHQNGYIPFNGNTILFKIDINYLVCLSICTSRPESHKYVWR